jgi:3-methyladenine DNA glycosylase Tag
VGRRVFPAKLNVGNPPLIKVNERGTSIGPRGQAVLISSDSLQLSSDSLQRCEWAQSDPLLRAYHDQEWGVPEHDSRSLWELLMLEAFQAGLAWITVLRKREAFRATFKSFDPQEVARYQESDVQRLLQDTGIIRSRAKIEATIGGARIYLAMQDAGEDCGSLKGAEEARFQVRRSNHCLRMDAGCWYCERSRGKLLSPKSRDVV